MYNPQIETFIKVADAGSFNKAAEELYITPLLNKSICLKVLLTWFCLSVHTVG